MPTLDEVITIAVEQHRAGNVRQAEHLYRQIVQVDPSQADVWHSLGVCCQDLGKPEDALQAFRQAARLKPDRVEAHFSLANLLRLTCRFDEAAVSYRRVLELTPDHALAYNNLGVVYAMQEKLTEAEACFRQAVRLMPDYAEGQNNLASALARLGKLDEAAAAYQHTLRLKPDYAEAYYNYGSALMDHGRLDEAVVQLQRAIQVKPDYAEAYNNLGNAYLGQARYAESLASYEQSVRLRPDYGEARWNRALSWLIQGNFEQGWPEYEWRRQHRDAIRRTFTQPQWDGSPLAGRSILLHGEQGFGDALQFIRYAPLVKQRGGTVILEASPVLLPILSSCPGIDRLIPEKTPLPTFDVQAALMSLPALFRTTLATVPRNVPYLFAKPKLIEHWRGKLSHVRGFKVGISWQGNRNYKRDRERSMPLVHFAPLAGVPGVQLISLQKGPGREQVHELAGRFSVLELGPEVDEREGAFMDTAAVMKNVDLVVTSDTANAHLAGALGVPVWVPLGHVPDWRFLLEREDFPWYPTMRLFRQSAKRSWDEVFERIARELAKLVSQAAEPKPIRVPLAPGELIDKITILEIKTERISDPDKRKNVQIELTTLAAGRDRSLRASAALAELTAELKAVNEALWDIEDAIRDCERGQDFGPKFVELARSVYRNNDRRAALKRKINELLGSRLIEEKSYAAYD